MGAAGVKITQLLSMVQFERSPQGEAPVRPLGTLPEERKPLAWRDVQRVLEQEHGAKLQDTFSAFEQKPFASSSVGQVHSAHTADGEHVAVKVQHPDVGAAIADELRNIGLVSPIIKLLAPRSDAAALLGEVRERVADELDYETEAQNQRRLGRIFRNHPHVRVPAVHTSLSTRRVLVSEYVEGQRIGAIASLPEAQRDRIGEIACRFYFGLVWREKLVAGDPHPDNLLLCADGRVCLLDFGLQRGVEAGNLDGERSVLRAISGADPAAVHDALTKLGYLSKYECYDAAGLLEHLGTASKWFLEEGVRRIDRAYVGRTLESGYPPRSQWFAVMQRMALPPATLLLRRMEVQLLSLLGELGAGGDWAAIIAEHWAGAPASTSLGQEDTAFFKR
jgi:predicted unusual protein kinase regulating ubiquinone biosynthesis (AarF/ABC1/UbiB family)